MLYVSETQEQADKHVQSVATLFERLGVDRNVGKYGTSKGWRRDQLRTANGFNVAAIGLDTAARGIKLDQYRPDLLILDDVDGHDDTEKTTAKKIAAITTALIPAGSADCAVLVVQNLIHEEGIVAQLVDGRADFLYEREVPPIEPAVRGLRVHLEPGPDGVNRYRIVAGEPTWAGQDLATCERQINEWGLAAFRREAQHEVRGAAGYVFNTDLIRFCDPEEVPAGLRKCRAWDRAATEGGGDYSAGSLVGMPGRPPDSLVYVLDMARGQWGAEKVNQRIASCAEQDGARVALRLPQDPGQAGKAQAEQDRIRFRKWSPVIVPVTGDKMSRAAGFADAVNRGNVILVRGAWNHAFLEELRKFREDESHAFDDQVDAVADAYNQLAHSRPRGVGVVSGRERAAI